MTCRHCHKGNPSRPRGLCHVCYSNPAIREQHPSTSKFARRGFVNQTAKLDCEPTDALPGSPEKMAVLRERSKAGQRLWHPDDATAPCHTPVNGSRPMSMRMERQNSGRLHRIILENDE